MKSYCSHRPLASDRKDHQFLRAMDHEGYLIHISVIDLEKDTPFVVVGRYADQDRISVWLIERTFGLVFS